MTRGPAKQFDPEVALTKAMEVFWTHGYEGASLSQLLNHMGISKKSLYDTFGNKRSLFLKALDRYTQTVTWQLRQQLLSSGSPLAHLEDLLQELGEIHSRPGSHGCMLGTNLADFDTEDAEIAAILREHLYQLEDAYRAVVIRAQVAGELNPAIAPGDLAQLLLHFHQGMVLVGRITEQPSSLQPSVQQLISLLRQA